MFRPNGNAYKAGALVGFLLVILLIPFVVIWSVNALFPAIAIAYSFKTWFAVYVLVQVFSPNPLKIEFE